MMRKSYKKLFAAALTGILAVSASACGASGEKAAETSGGNSSVLEAGNPTTITLWNYYNGDQLTAFDNLVSEFNSTVGIEKGIAVESISQGSIENLADSLIDAADGKVGAQDLPTLASIYAETAYIMKEKELLVDLDSYFTEEELSGYVKGFIEEGRMTEGGGLYLFPVSKSTECFAVNKTDWAAFEEATGVGIDSIDSYETLAQVAEQYYVWSDGLTPDIPEDGRALYGRDSMANYLYIGAAQLGHEIFKVTEDGMSMDLDRGTFRTLWDNYYIPYINGYFTAESNYRSEDMKTGKILALTGSTSGISYLPTAVTDADDESHDIELTVKKPLQFKNGEAIAVQQGAGYCVVKGTEAEQEAAAEFLRWLTESDRNLEFSVSSGYSAVTMEANDAEKIKENFVGSGDSIKDQNILNALLVSADVYMNEETYTNKPFDGSKDVRALLDAALSDIAAADRAAVVEAIASGTGREEAVAPFSTEEYFDQWFDDFCQKVEGIVK